MVLQNSQVRDKLDKLEFLLLNELVDTWVELYGIAAEERRRAKLIPAAAVKRKAAGESLLVTDPW